jgi:hypothetical protein
MFISHSGALRRTKQYTEEYLQGEIRSFCSAISLTLRLTPSRLSTPTCLVSCLTCDRADTASLWFLYMSGKMLCEETKFGVVGGEERWGSKRDASVYGSEGNRPANSALMHA